MQSNDDPRRLFPGSPRLRRWALLSVLVLAGGSGVSARGPLDQATRQFEAEGARVLAVEQREHGGRPMVRFKLLTGKGRVRHVWVDPVTGKPERSRRGGGRGRH